MDIDWLLKTHTIYFTLLLLSLPLMKSPVSIAFHTLGCKLNFSETSTISRSFRDGDFVITDFKEQADVYVINTCTVTENAERKCKAVIKQAVKRNPDAVIAVIGCFSQLRYEEITKIPGVDIVLGTTAKFRLFDVLKDFLKNETHSHEALIDAPDERFIPSYSIHDRTRSFFKIQDGCDYHCAYCTVPLARGNSRSDSIANTMALAKEIAATDVKEIILTGVNVGDFGKPRGEKFIDLLQELETLDDIERIRISSIEPDLLTDEIISLVAQSKKFLPHFHIPLQSASDKVLKAMRRRYDSTLFRERILKIKELMPLCCVAIDMIAGFPGESDEEFDTTFNFLKAIPVSYMHIFPYSERAATTATGMKDKVPSKIKKLRVDALHHLSDQKKKIFYEQNKGMTALVLFESDNIHGFMHGFTENYVKVKTVFDSSLINQIIPVTLTHLEKDLTFAVDIKNPDK